MASEDILIIMLSVGFIILIALFSVALGAAIKILIDMRKITDKLNEMVDSAADAVGAVSSKAKSVFTNTLVMDKIIPAVLGAISVGIGIKKAKEASQNKAKKGRSKKFSKVDVYEEDE